MAEQQEGTSTTISPAPSPAHSSGRDRLRSAQEAGTRCATQPAPFTAPSITFASNHHSALPTAPRREPRRGRRGRSTYTCSRWRRTSRPEPERGCVPRIARRLGLRTTSGRRPDAAAPTLRAEHSSSTQPARAEIHGDRRKDRARQDARSRLLGRVEDRLKPPWIRPPPGKARAGGRSGSSGRRVTSGTTIVGAPTLGRASRRHRPRQVPWKVMYTIRKV